MTFKEESVFLLVKALSTNIYGNSSDKRTKDTIHDCDATKHTACIKNFDS